MIKKQIVIYGGRFQPMHNGHYEVYLKLCKEFGKDNVIITTSDKVIFPKNPFNFKEKKEIMTTMFPKIIAKNIIQVVNSYNPVNVWKILKNQIDENTIAIYALGEKDSDRLINGKFFKDYNKETLDVGYSKAGYVYTVEMKGQTKDGFISGTELRNVFSTEQSENKKKSFFDIIYGKYNKKIYNLIVSKLSIMKENFNKPNNSTLNEGGSAGHMMHPWESNNLSFSEMKWIIANALEGRLEVNDYKPQIKSDGQNLLITMKNGRVLASRNKGDRKHFAENGMSLKDIESKFAGRGEISIAFTKAMSSIENRLLRIPKKIVDSVFENGKKFINLEIIYSGTQNVIDYQGLHGVIFHNILEFDYEGNQINSDASPAKYLTKLLKNVKSDIVNDMGVLEIKPAKLNKILHSEKYKKELFNNLNNVMNEFNLSDSSSILDYKIAYFKKNVMVKFNISDEAVTLLLNRWVLNIKNPTILKIYKIVSDDVQIELIKRFDKTELADLLKTIDKPLRLVFLQLGVYVIKNLESYITLDRDKSKENLQQIVKKTIKDLETATDLDAKTMNKINSAIENIYTLGGINNISPEEGIIFKFNSKLYKLSGLFADINQILGVFKF